MAKFFAAFTLTSVALCLLNLPVVAIKPDYTILVPTTIESRNKMLPYKVPAHNCIINVLDGDEQLLDLILTQCLTNRKWLRITGGVNTNNIQGW